MPVPTRPGICPDTLAKAGVVYTDEPEPGSILIPYWDIKGELLPFWRVRLAKERPDGQKYSQDPGSEPHIYFPPEVLKPADDFVLTEGEFKFLSLWEQGYQGVALPGLNCYRNPWDRKDRPSVPPHSDAPDGAEPPENSDSGDNDDSGDEDSANTAQWGRGRYLYPELINALRVVRPNRILFFGDSDTCHNFHFVLSAYFLAHKAPLVLESEMPVVLPRLPVGGPKGIDDFKTAHLHDFPEQFNTLLSSALTVQLSDSRVALAVKLLAHQKDNLIADQKSDSPIIERGKLQERLFQFAYSATFCEESPETDQEELKALICEILGLRKNSGTYNKELKRRRREADRLLKSAREDLSENLSQDQAGRTVLHQDYGTRYLSHVAEDLGGILAPYHVLFVDPEDALVEVHPEKPELREIFPPNLKEIAEHELVRPVKRGRKGFYDEAICIGDYGTIYRMRRLRKPLPHIRRVIPGGLPIRFDGRIFIPKPGRYHPEAQVYVMPYDVVPVPCASLAEARDRIERLCRNSLFKPGTCSYTNFIAQVLVSGLRYVLAPESRFPLFVHRGNRPRLGKDYHCAIPQILFTGTWDENPPLAGDPDEVRKTLFAAARARRLFYSISNQRDDIESNGPFEQIITAPSIGGRVLGLSKHCIVALDVIFSMTLNGTVRLSTDLLARQRLIEHEWLEDSDPERRFNGDRLTLEQLKADRGFYRGAWQFFFQTWEAEGFHEAESWASFDEWSRYGGGLMEACGYDNPGGIQTGPSLGYDAKMETARGLYAVIFERHPNRVIDKKTLQECAATLCEESDIAADYLQIKSEEFCRVLGVLAADFHGRKLDIEGVGLLQLSVQRAANRTKTRYKVEQVGLPVDLSGSGTSSGNGAAGSPAPPPPAQPKTPPAEAFGSTDDLARRYTDIQASIEEEFARGFPPEGPTSPPPPPKRKYDYVG